MQYLLLIPGAVSLHDHNIIYPRRQRLQRESNGSPTNHLHLHSPSSAIIKRNRPRERSGRFNGHMIRCRIRKDQPILSRPDPSPSVTGVPEGIPLITLVLFSVIVESKGLTVDTEKKVGVARQKPIYIITTIQVGAKTTRNTDIDRRTEIDAIIGSIQHRRWIPQPTLPRRKQKADFVSASATNYGNIPNSA